MLTKTPRALLYAFYGSGVLALIGMDQRIFWLSAIFKTLTTLLLFPVVGKLNTPFRKKIAAGLVFSLAGDVALLFDGGTAFKVGLAAFLITHIIYIVAFAGVAVRSIYPVIAGVLGVAASTLTVLLSATVAKEQGVLIPVAVYAAALTTMLTFGHATLGGRLLDARHVALGSLLFYIADSSLALTTFVPWIHIPHPVILTSGVYWVGQLWIAAAAHTGIAAQS